MGKPTGSMTTNAGQPAGSMLPSGTATPPGVSPGSNGAQGPMGIPGYTPGSTVSSPPQQGAPPIMGGPMPQRPQQQQGLPPLAPQGPPPGTNPNPNLTAAKTTPFKFPPQGQQPPQGPQI